MTDFIGLHEQYALVPPQTFVDRFAQRWTEIFDMPASGPLRELWRIMANTYQDAILDAAHGRPHRWRVLSLLQAQGKPREPWCTQGSKLNSTHLRRAV